ncbi:MAG: NAD-dependent epimerase/dehydratase family protein [candidate division Zixibacteria bacterium]|nr:NAD-dependent epimerase/dehydratase family protein [candidate division Zixibacteria bacterium]
MTKILVTGGAGFIGSNIADSFISFGHKVVVIDNLSTGFKKNIPSKAKFYKIDIRSKKIEEIFKNEKIEVLCHYAAQIDVRKSVEDPIQDARINIEGTLNLLNNCIKYKTRKVIFASTGGALYGEQDYFPADEKHPERPLSPYGIAKLAIEKYLYFYKEVFGLNYISLRYANVYGPRQNPLGEAGVVAIFTQRLLSGKKSVINGDGKQTRDFVYVKDVVKANLSALNYPESDYFNIGTGIESDVNNIFRLLKGKTGSKQKEVHGPAKPGEQKRSVLDYSKAKKLLGWSPEYSLEIGIEETVKYYQEKIKQ